MTALFSLRKKNHMDFEIRPERILELLHQSLNSETLVGIYAPAVLGAGIFITTVDCLNETGSDVLISLRPYDSTGYILPKSKLMLSEICKIYSFSSQMDNPYLKSLTGERFYQIVN
jgi:hypothetical protein